MSLRLTLLASLVLVVTTGACDSNDDYDYYRGDVVVVDFTIDGDGYEVSDDGFVASYDTDDVELASDRDGLRDALREAGDGALVVAYIDSEVVLDVNGTGQTYSALPLTRGYEGQPILVDEDGDGVQEEIPYVDYTVTYEYSFDNQDFYFDVTSSAQLAWEQTLPREIDMRQMTDADVRAITDRMNATPRKCLGWRTPAEVFAQKMVEIGAQRPYSRSIGKSHFT